MNILDSAWLIKMLKKSGKSPRERLLCLFDILSDWADAPNVRLAMLQDTEVATVPKHLLHYLSEEAQATGAQLPEALAQQLYFIALGALQETLRAPDKNNFEHAKIAASALISAQTEPEAPKKKVAIYGIAASLLVLVMAAGLWIYKGQFFAHNPSLALEAAIKNTTNDDADAAPSPKHTAEMYASLEQIRKGDCRFVEALQIPDADKRVYIENVIGGRVPDNAKDMAVAQHYLEKISCNYTPMLMKNSLN